MAIVQMFGFDQITPSPANIGSTGVQKALTAEGFDPLVVEMAGVNAMQFIANQDRTWLQFTSGYVSSTIRSRLTMSMLEWFGPNPDKKKMYTGARINIAANGQGTNWSYLWTINNATVFSFAEIPIGTVAFYEVCFDPEKSIIQRWIDGVQLSDIAWTYNETHQMAIGLYLTNQYLPSWVVQMTDIYSLIDTGDDTPCTRLGAIRVSPLSFESVVAPADWQLLQPVYVPENVYLGVPYRRPYPVTSSDVYEGYRYSCNYAPRGGAITYHNYSPTSTVEFGLTRPTQAAPLQFTLQLVKPLKMALYKMQRSNSSACFYPTRWTVEASNNGTDWTQLDSQTGQGTPVTSVVSQYVIPEANRGSYLYYRVSFTDATAVGAANYLHVCGLQFWMPSEDPLINALEALDKDYFYDLVAADETGGALRTGVLETTLVANVKKPVLNGEIPLKVQLRVSGARDSGSENRLLVTTRSGATVLPEVPVTLNPTMNQGVLVYSAHKAPDGTPWTPDTIDALELLIKSKTGAA